MSEQLSGRALDRAIAEKLGYTVVGSDAEGYDLFDPQGKHIYPDGGKLFVYDTPEKAWARAGSWSTDTNAQIAVCMPRGWSIYIGLMTDDDDDERPYADVGVDVHEYYSAYGATPQEAGARAILAALEAHAE